MNEWCEIEVGNATKSYCFVSGSQLNQTLGSRVVHTVSEDIECLRTSPHPYGKPDRDQILIFLGISRKAEAAPESRGS